MTVVNESAGLDLLRTANLAYTAYELGKSSGGASKVKNKKPDLTYLLMKLRDTKDKADRSKLLVRIARASGAAVQSSERVNRKGRNKGMKEASKLYQKGLLSKKDIADLKKEYDSRKIPAGPNELSITESVSYNDFVMTECVHSDGLLIG